MINTPDWGHINFGQISRVSRRRIMLFESGASQSWLQSAFPGGSPGPQPGFYLSASQTAEVFYCAAVGAGAQRAATMSETRSSSTGLEG
jgi:hypothetical protein